MRDRLFDELTAYLRRNFQSDVMQADGSLFSGIHVRYELGEPFRNGSTRRIQQVNRRATAIIEDCFEPRDKILLLINDWVKPNDLSALPTGHLYELIDREDLSRSNRRILESSIDEEQEDEQTDRSSLQMIVSTSFGELGYKEILAGIANLEQGREPSIAQNVFFIAPDRDIIFHMYDDRGCIVFSDAPKKLMHLYRKYNDWLVDYWRESIDEIFTKLL